MPETVKTFQLEVLPNGMRRYWYGDKFEAIELEDGGWLGFLNGVPVEMEDLLAVIWTIYHSEDKRHPEPEQGRYMLMGFIDKLGKDFSFRDMTRTVYECARTIPSNEL